MKLNIRGVTTITGEEIFQPAGHSFSVSPSAEGYTLKYSTKGDDVSKFTAYGTDIPANEDLVISFPVRGMYFFLSGNNSTVTVNCDI